MRLSSVTMNTATLLPLFNKEQERPSQELVRSPMNYIGGKFKLLPQILPHFPNNVNVFVDLFCGGCNVGINAEASQVVFNDNLTYLIDLYKVMYSSSIDVILNHIRNRISEFSLSLTNNDGYIALRKLYNDNRNPLDLFVLVAYSFNHQIRFNTSHDFNNPFGKERSSFNPRMENNLIAFIQKLQSRFVSFSSSNFDDFDFAKLTINDFVYCDPPYLITTGSYNDGKRGFTGWNKSHEIKLLSILDDLNNRGVRFALSNVLIHKGNQNNLLAEWLEANDYFVHHLYMNYSNSSYHLKDRGATVTDEVLITNYVGQ